MDHCFFLFYLININKQVDGPLSLSGDGVSGREDLTPTDKEGSDETPPRSLQVTSHRGPAAHRGSSNKVNLGKLWRTSNALIRVGVKCKLPLSLSSLCETVYVFYHHFVIVLCSLDVC